MRDGGKVKITSIASSDRERQRIADRINRKMLDCECTANADCALSRPGRFDPVAGRHFGAAAHCAGVARRSGDGAGWPWFLRVRARRDAAKCP